MKTNTNHRIIILKNMRLKCSKWRWASRGSRFREQTPAGGEDVVMMMMMITSCQTVRSSCSSPWSALSWLLVSGGLGLWPGPETSPETGRRLPPGNKQHSNTAPEVTFIPLLLIERVSVVSRPSRAHTHTLFRGHMRSFSSNWRVLINTSWFQLLDSSSSCETVDSLSSCFRLCDGF